MVTITLDGKTIDAGQGMTGIELVQQTGAKNIIAMQVDSDIRELTRVVDQDAQVKLLTFEDAEGKHAFWHSSAHILAQAVVKLFPDAKPTIGPAIDSGFYYDFANLELKEDDFSAIEAEIKKILKAKYKFIRHVITKDKALSLFKDNKFKLELINEYAEEGRELTAYEDGDFIDLCEGPHLQHTGKIGAVKLLQISSAHWRGKDDNEKLTRVYGISFPEKKQLRQWLMQREEALKRDHVRLGKKLDLFVMNEHVGKGLPLLTPKGATIYRELFRFIQDEELKRGYQFTQTPVLAKTDLYKISGHLDHYRDGMFIFTMGGEEFALRPMTCPHQYMIYSRKRHSYRELPVRLAEISSLFRAEQSGELHGLIRIRQFTLADAHIICRPDQVDAEFEAVLKLIQYVMNALGFDEYWYQFSKNDPKNKEKYVDNPQMWKSTQTQMKRILDKLKLNYVEKEDEAAFYGPKLDIQMRNVHGKEDTIFTIQLDFVAPERFDLKYVDEHDREQRPMVIHRSSIGCLERTMALLIEKYAGKFPLWISPEQVRVLTVADRFNEYGQSVVDTLHAAGVRATLDGGHDTISKKVRQAQLDYVNYIIVVGEREVEDETVTVRTRANKVLGAVRLDTFVEDVVKKIKEHDTTV